MALSLNTQVIVLLAREKWSPLGFGAHFFSICLSCQAACYAREVGDYL